VSEVGRLLGVVHGSRRWLVVGGLFAVVAVAANVALMGLSAYLIARAAVATSVADIVLAVTGVRVLAIARAGSRYLERYTTHLGALRILVALRVWFYSAAEPLAPAHLGDRRTGDLLARAVEDVDRLEDFYVRVLVPPLVAALVVVAMSALYGSLDLRLGIVLLLVFLADGLLRPLLVRRLSTRRATSLATLRGQLAATIVDEVHGAADLVVLDAAEAHRARSLELAGKVDGATRELAAIEAVGSSVSAFLASVAGLAVLAMAIPLVTRGQLDGVLLAALPLAAMAAFEAVAPMSRAAQLLDTTRGSAHRLFELADAPLPVVDPIAPLTVPPCADAPGLEAAGLWFRYDASGPWVLRDVSLRVPGGSRTAVVGPSGAGKSTLSALLVRFRDYERGAIRLGGRELRGMRADDVRACLSVVPQDVHLFATTIRDNLALADAAATDDEMLEACRVAQLETLLARLPHGLDTMVGEDGARLSGGERRRLAVARAVLRDAPLVVLDEVAADLDAATAAALWDALDRWLAGRTVIVLAHEARFAMRVDQVVTLEPPEASGTGQG
jgi:thiol reductant ABC exporter CydC subunit